jgi:PhzF family phenazine biosynthesis protein
MKQKMYQIDAFTDTVFHGNPAAVCPLDRWLSNEIMQKIAMENNLSETAFYVKKGDRYHIRWFTPTIEVDLCGHATLAAAYVLFNYESHTENTITFITSSSGILKVTKKGDLLTLDFPADRIEGVEVSDIIKAGFNLPPEDAFRGKTDYLLVYKTENDIKNLVPDFEKISIMDCRGVIVTAKGNEVDFVSRFFGPQSGVNEDPVTGSAHTTLAPYWSGKLGKTDLTAIQLSARKGYLQCRHLGERVEISGKCRLYLIGEIHLEHKDEIHSLKPGSMAGKRIGLFILSKIKLTSGQENRTTFSVSSIAYQSPQSRTEL